MLARAAFPSFFLTRESGLHPLLPPITTSFFPFVPKSSFVDPSLLADHLMIVAGFILLLLITLSVPIIKTIYLLNIESVGGSTAANIGVLGECYKGGNAQ